MPSNTERPGIISGNVEPPSKWSCNEMSKHDLLETAHFIKTIDMVVWGLMLGTQEVKKEQSQMYIKKNTGDMPRGQTERNLLSRPIRGLRDVVVNLVLTRVWMKEDKKEGFICLPQCSLLPSFVLFLLAYSFIHSLACPFQSLAPITPFFENFNCTQHVLLPSDAAICNFI
jgi:hypothetical protein